MERYHVYTTCTHSRVGRTLMSNYKVKWPNIHYVKNTYTQYETAAFDCNNLFQLRNNTWEMAKSHEQEEQQQQQQKALHFWNQITLHFRSSFHSSLSPIPRSDDNINPDSGKLNQFLKHPFGICYFFLFWSVERCDFCVLINKKRHWWSMFCVFRAKKSTTW